MKGLLERSHDILDEFSSIAMISIILSTIKPTGFFFTLISIIRVEELFL